MAHQRWSDLTRGQRIAVVLTGVVQVLLALSAWYDLGRRRAEAVRGPKRLWAMAIAVNFIGPIAYFRYGRLPETDRQDR